MKTLEGLPQGLFLEMEAFKRRNSLAMVSNKKEKKSQHQCCGNCLKAHALQRVREMKLPKRVENSLNKIFKCKMGHYGYYMDLGELIKI